MYGNKKTIIILSLVLLSLFVIISLISPSATADIPLEKIPIVQLVLLLMISGVTYIFLIKNLENSGKVLNFIIALGLLLRVLMILTPPAISVDYFRYLWDGAVLAKGTNPYLYSPIEIMSIEKIPENLVSLANQPGSTVSKIIFPNLRTPYPPVTQLIFAISHLLLPWSLLTWKLILLLFDFTSLGLLLRLLNELDLPYSRVSIYWLNPILLKEIFNSGHMDVIILPFILAGILLFIKKNYYPAIILLSLSVGVKIWPIILLPIFLSHLPNKRKAFSSLVIFILLCSLIFYPIYISGIDESLGIIAYARNWQYNGSIFKILLTVSQSFLKVFNISQMNGWLLVSILTALIFIIWNHYVLSLKSKDSMLLIRQCALIISGFILLIPSFFPWYYVWVIPFMVIQPMKSIILLNSLLPLYYLQFYFLAQNQLWLFDSVIIFIQFLPVWILVANEWVVNLMSSRGNGEINWHEV
jgi:hypothetical protein